MNRIITTSPSLPGAYFHDKAGADSALPQHDTCEPTRLNNMAIISPIFFSPSLSPGTLRTSLPGTWVDSSPFPLTRDNDTNNEKENNHTLANSHRHYHQRYHSTPSPILDDADMDHLRETIASLKERAKQLEQTDLVVKKSIEIVAKKRRMAHHQRLQHSQWDWCDQPNDNYTTTNDKASVPVLDDLDETDHSDDDHDGCGGDWEWVD